MIVGVPRESYPGERRVALVPAVLANLAKAGIQVTIEAGAGASAGYPDAEYSEKGAKIVGSRTEVFAAAEIVTQVLCHGSNDRTGKADLSLLRPGQILVGFLRPLGALETLKEVASTAVISFAVELMPRTRLRNGAGRRILSQAARIAGRCGGRERRGDHGCCNSREKIARAGDERDGRPDGAGISDCRSGRGARRKLRTHTRRRNDCGTGSDDHRAAQSREHSSLSCQPDVCAEPDSVSAESGEGRKSAVQ